MSDTRASRRAARTRSASWFWWALAGVAVVGLAVRIAYILGWHRDYVFGGDPFFYHAGANLLADGKGFISPYSPPHHPIAASDHPPLYMLYLAIPSVLGLQSVLTHMLWSAVLGTGTVVLVGLTGREVGGPRLGIIAAVLAAVAPNIWVSDGLLRAESMAMFTVALALYLSYRYWRRPTGWGLAAVGAAGGAAALSRAELVLIIPLLVVPLAVLAPGPTRRQRWAGIGAGLLAALVLMSPWLVFNLTRFEKPELLSTSFGPLLATTSCDQVWNSDNKSYFSIACTVAIQKREGKPGDDESQLDAIYRHAGLEYIKHHKHQLPGVVAARAAAIVGLYHPDLQIRIDSSRGVEKSELAIARAIMYTFYALAVLAIVGAVVLRRRRTAPVFPLLVPPVVVMVTVIIGYAAMRFRAPADLALCILAAVALDAAINAATGRGRGSEPGTSAPGSKTDAVEVSPVGSDPAAR
ncbi:MAG TPA: glycosyltransferase family 39 protein [Acidimicrobiia bacterium]